MFNKFKQKICWILCHQFCFISVATTMPGVVLHQQQAADVHYYKHLAISSVNEDDNSHDSLNTEVRKKIVIQPVISRLKPTTDVQEHTVVPSAPELGKPLWEITLKQLPISKSHCLASKVITCDKDNDYCYKPCFVSFPQLIAFDESRGKLYLAVAGIDQETAVRTYFTFVADINKKKIKYLHDEFGTLNGSLSPSGEYLLINNKVYDTQTDEYFIINKKNIYDLPERRQFHDINQIKWLSDTQFTYRESVARENNQVYNFSRVTEYAIDIPARKIIYSQTLKPEIRKPLKNSDPAKYVTSYEMYPHEKIYYYKNVAITTIDGNDNSHDSFMTKAPGKIIIQAMDPKVNPTTSDKEYIDTFKRSRLRKAIWAITVEQLPMTAMDCIMLEIDECSDNSTYCYKPCFTSSPRFLAFDENRGKLYLAVDNTQIGTAGSGSFIFVADVNKKKIKFLHKEFSMGPLNVSLSPFGKYFLVNNGSIRVYDTSTYEMFLIYERDIFDPPEKRQLHYLKHIKWLGDNQLVYQDIMRHDKSHREPDGITEYIVDIRTKKTISKRIIKVDTNNYKHEEA